MNQNTKKAIWLTFRSIAPLIVHLICTVLLVVYEDGLLFIAYVSLLLSAALVWLVWTTFKEKLKEVEHE